MAHSEDDPRLIRLSSQDNVRVVATNLREGEEIVIAGETVTLSRPLSLGHKLAACPISKGETVYKYNFPIGVASENIATGAHVHTHNLQSRHTPTYIIPEA